MEVGKCVNLPYNMVAKRDYAGVNIYIPMADNIHKGDATYTLDIQDMGEYVFDNGAVTGSFSIQEDKYNEWIFMEKMYTKWIQCDIMKVNLQLRTRRAGDYIVVDGKGSKKKLKDYFIDLKIPRDEREQILLLANGNEIVWIIGYRLNWNYRVTDELQGIYKLEVKMKK
jgi:tRNA(Ile)-lysidine synthase